MGLSPTNLGQRHMYPEFERVRVSNEFIYIPEPPVSSIMNWGQSHLLPSIGRKIKGGDELGKFPT